MKDTHLFKMIKVYHLPYTHPNYGFFEAFLDVEEEFIPKFVFVSCPFQTPPEGLSGSGQFPRLMNFTQLFFGISGTQNRRDQNFLTRTFSVITILRYPTFPYCFYYIAILQLSYFREIFTIFLASSDKMYLES